MGQIFLTFYTSCHEERVLEAGLLERGRELSDGHGCSMHLCPPHLHLCPFIPVLLDLARMELALSS